MYVRRFSPTLFAFLSATRRRYSRRMAPSSSKLIATSKSVKMRWDIAFPSGSSLPLMPLACKTSFRSGCFLTTL